MLPAGDHVGSLQLRPWGACSSSWRSPPASGRGG